MTKLFKSPGIAVCALGLLCISSVALICPFAISQSPSREKTKRDLIEIERRIGAANVNCDYKYFAQVEGPEFIFTDGNGAVTNREQDLAGEAGCKPSASTYEVDDAKVWLNGTTAVVTGRVTIRKPAPALTIATRTRFTDVFAFRNGRWQLVAGHSSRIRETPVAP